MRRQWAQQAASSGARELSPQRDKDTADVHGSQGWDLPTKKRLNPGNIPSLGRVTRGPGQDTPGLPITPWLLDLQLPRVSQTCPHTLITITVVQIANFEHGPQEFFENSTGDYEALEVQGCVL